MEVHYLGQRDYESVWHKMQDFTDARSANSPDQLWVVEHPPVFTLGQAGKPEHLLDPGDIPVVDVDRGGQVTYHGPGQLVIYVLINLKRYGLGVRQLVSALENAVIQLLDHLGIKASARSDAPGVYVDGAKIASLGLKIRKGCSYHGLALNVDMDLEPFSRINPCGFPGLEVTRLRDHGVTLSSWELAGELCELLHDEIAA
jgi:lipoyl(octanoyl) transferase